jgi:hypothetical protein
VTLTNRRDDEEQIDPRVVAAIRAATRAEQDDEYEASTVGADAWRDRLAQRHRFGRVLDKPKVRSDLDDSRWLVWFALYLAAVVVALVVIWLVAS